MPIKSNKIFAKECVIHGFFLGVNPHYLMATAQLRGSGINDDTEGDRVGPFRITQQMWDANGNAADLEIVLEPSDITRWRLQCLFAALTAFRAQNRLLDQLGRFPSAFELYQEQWLNEPVELAKLQAALAATEEFIDPAVEDVTGKGLSESSALKDAEIPAAVPVPDPGEPMPQKSQEKFVFKAPRIMEKLIADFSLSDFQAAAILGNIGHECNGFNTMQEAKPLVPGSRGGFGWCQWTASRRDGFEEFCKNNGFDLTSDAANYGNLKRELQSTHASSLDVVKGTATISAAVREFEKKFQRAKAGLEHFDRRDEWAKLALDAFRKKAREAGALLPIAVVKELDPDLIYRVVATAKSGATTFWVVDQFGEQGGQALIKEGAGSAAEILDQDTTVFPLKEELELPAGVRKALSADLEAPASPPPPKPPAPVATDEEVAKRVFDEAKKCDDLLVTRNVPNTRGGRVACAWAVNEVVRRTLGKPVGGGLSTAAMSKVLNVSHAKVPESKVAAGMIVISPTQGGNVGHVGIVGAIKTDPSATLVYSNSSNRGVFSHAFTLAKWKNFYGVRKGLPVLFFALKIASTGPSPLSLGPGPLSLARRAQHRRKRR